MKVTFTCSGKDENGNSVELELTVENEPASVYEFYNFCKVCQKRNLTDVNLIYSFEGSKDIHLFTFFYPYNYQYKKPKKTFLEWIKSLFN